MPQSQPVQNEEEDQEHDNPALDAIQDKLNIIDHKNSELAGLEMETRPEDVLVEIHRLQVLDRSKS